MKLHMNVSWNFRGRNFKGGGGYQSFIQMKESVRVEVFLDKIVVGEKTTFKKKRNLFEIDRGNLHSKQLLKVIYIL